MIFAGKRTSLQSSLRGMSFRCLRPVYASDGHLIFFAIHIPHECTAPNIMAHLNTLERVNRPLVGICCFVFVSLRITPLGCAHEWQCRLARPTTRFEPLQALCRRRRPLLLPRNRHQAMLWPCQRVQWVIIPLRMSLSIVLFFCICLTAVFACPPRTP